MGGELPGSPWQRSPARIPAPRPPWGLAAGAGGRAGTGASWDKDGFPVSRVAGAGGRLGRGAVWCRERAPSLHGGPPWGAEGAGPPPGTAGPACGRCCTSRRRARLVPCRLQVVMNTLKKRILQIMKRQVVSLQARVWVEGITPRPRVEEKMWADPSSSSRADCRLFQIAEEVNLESRKASRHRGQSKGTLVLFFSKQVLSTSSWLSRS